MFITSHRSFGSLSSTPCLFDMMKFISHSSFVPPLKISILSLSASVYHLLRLPPSLRLPLSFGLPASLTHTQHFFFGLPPCFKLNRPDTMQLQPPYFQFLKAPNRSVYTPLWLTIRSLFLPRLLCRSFSYSIYLSSLVSWSTYVSTMTFSISLESFLSLLQSFLRHPSITPSTFLLPSGERRRSG